MKPILISKYLLLAATLIFTLSCCEKNRNVEIKEDKSAEVPQRMRDTFNARTEKLKKTLINQVVPSLDSILLANEIKGHGNMILYYASIDCSSCVHTGLDFLERLGKTGKQSAAILSGSLYVNGPLSKVLGFIHDEQAKIQNDLGYVLTPSLIYYDKNTGIKDLYVIPTFEDSTELSRFEQRVKVYDD